MSTKRTVIFTGAGASAAFGYPITRELLPSIRKSLIAGDAFEGIEPSKQKNQDLRKFLGQMLPGFEKVAAKHLPLITDVMSLVDISLHQGSALIPRRTQQDMAYFRRLLEEAIFHDIYADYKSRAEANRYGALVARFGQGLLHLARRPDHELALVSTNYDFPVDQWLFNSYGSYASIANAFDFGMAWRSEYSDYYARPSKPEIRLYKLHGSLNWLRCELCEHVYVNTRGSIVHQAFVTEIKPANQCICGHAPLRSVLVTPSFIRDIRDVALLTIWNAAIEALRLADEWIIVGYSFPAEDIAVRSLFLRAFQGRDGSGPPRVRVILRSKSPETMARYRLFFPKADFDDRGMTGFIDELYKQTKRAPAGPKTRKARSDEPIWPRRRSP
jgi:hypothetical protein